MKIKYKINQGVWSFRGDGDLYDMTMFTNLKEAKNAFELAKNDPSNWEQLTGSDTLITELIQTQGDDNPIVIEHCEVPIHYK